MRKLDRLVQGTKPLAHWVPDRELLLRDPQTTLALQPVRIPASSLRGLAVPVGLLLAMGWLVSLLTGEVYFEQFALSLFLGLLVVVIHSVNRGRELVLEPRGVELRSARETILLPWQLFAVEGEAEESKGWLEIPLNEEALDEVELHKGGLPWSRGTGSVPIIRGNLLRVPMPYPVHPQELGDLILDLGRRLQELGFRADTTEQPAPEDTALDAGSVSIENGPLLTFGAKRFLLDGEFRGLAYDHLLRLHPELRKLLRRSVPGRRAVLGFRIWSVSALAFAGLSGFLLALGSVSWILFRTKDRLRYAEPEEPESQMVQAAVELLASLPYEAILWAGVASGVLSLGFGLLASYRLHQAIEHARRGIVSTRRGSQIYETKPVRRSQGAGIGDRT